MSYDLEAQISHLSDDSQHVPETSKVHPYDQEAQSSHNYRSDQTYNDLIHTITTSGTDQEFIHIDRKKYRKSDLLQAFGGSLVPGYQQKSTYQFANPAPLGLCAFAFTTFLLSLINCQARSVSTPNIVVSSAIFYGGLVQLLTGMWEIALGNSFGGTALSSYGGFWLSFGGIYIPWFNVAGAYTNKEELDSAVGFYLIGWCIFTFGLTILTMKSTVAFFSLFFMLALTFLMLAISKFTGSVACNKAGGVLGLITAFIAWYNAFAGLADKSNSYITAHAIRLPENIFKKST
ncbi:hypothetical protein WICPIJ_004745 [Wickerhamomyces pijperi]|uniref:Ammonia transport outward protein 2 n=1 Tax=Wickerhamomyces pijperi TaxID=599730 RepID=A0A9P8Q700_WICPI|nr:hypothetical protein WICPIJ_004745 [Wickerhamomyces pijperi]